MAATVAYMLSIHILFDTHVWHLLLHLRNPLLEPFKERVALTADTDASTRLPPSWTFSKRQSSHKTRRCDFSHTANFAGIFITLCLLQTILALHIKEVARAGQHFVEHSHDACKHLWSHILVDLGVAFKVKLRSLPKDVICESHDFILITLALEEALLCPVVQAFFVYQLLAKFGLGSTQIFLCFKGNIAEEDSHIFRL